MLDATDLKLVLKRGWQRGLKTAVREEGWGASVGSLFGVLLLTQVFLVLMIGAHSGLQFLKARTDVRLEILDGASDVQIQDLYQNLRSLPYVEDVLYITKQQAYERQKQRDPQLVTFLEKFGIANPFPETMGVRLASLDDYPKLVAFLEQPVFARTVNPKFLSQTTDQEAQIYRLMDVIRSARAILLAVIALLVVILTFIVVELTRRRAALRSEELFLEQLVGATPLMTLLPFGVEMLALLTFGLILSLLFAAGCLFLLPLMAPSLATGGLFAAWTIVTRGVLLRLAPWLLLAEIIVLPFIAAIGAFFGLWPRLRAATLSITHAF